MAKGTDSDNWKHRRAIGDSVTAAYAKVIRKSKKAAAMQSAMAPEVLREMALGMDKKNDMFEGSHPSFFSNRVGLMYKAEKRKIGKEFLEVNLNSVAYDFCLSTVPNEMDKTTGLYQPDLLGRKMRATSNVKLEKKLFHCDGESLQGFKSTDMSNLVHADVSIEHVLRLFSLVGMRKSYLSEVVKAYMEQLSNEKLSGGELAKLAGILKELTGEKSQFRHETVSLDVIPTSDYTLRICRTRHLYNATNNAYGLEVQKTIVLASTYGGPHQHIPVCEELVIQLKLPDTSGETGAPVLVNQKNSCIISCSLADETILHKAHMHYFGDNAFSVAYTAVTDQLPMDKTKICARLAGTLAKHMQNMNSTDIEKVKAGVDFFKPMFARGYTINPADNRVHAELLKNLLDSTISVSDAAKATQLDATHDPNELAIVKRTLGSFLKRQNIRNYIEVDTGKCCNVVKWMSSQSFSVLSLSPYGKPHINCVFVLTYSSPVDNISHGVERLRPAALRASVPSELRVHSMLTPDLEDELSDFC